MPIGMACASFKSDTVNSDAIIHFLPLESSSTGFKSSCLTGALYLTLRSNSS